MQAHNLPIDVLLQVFILDTLASRNAESLKDANDIIERVAPRLQHANSAVVLSAIKVVSYSAKCNDASGHCLPSFCWLQMCWIDYHSIRPNWQGCMPENVWATHIKGLAGKRDTMHEYKVWLSWVQVILRQLPIAADESLALSMHKKMAPPLVTLLSGESELQYVALRNINIIVHKYPQILAHEVKVFFCKYNDPIYVKMVRAMLWKPQQTPSFR